MFSMSFVGLTHACFAADSSATSINPTVKNFDGVKQPTPSTTVSIAPNVVPVRSVALAQSNASQSVQGKPGPLPQATALQSLQATAVPLPRAAAPQSPQATALQSPQTNLPPSPQASAKSEGETKTDTTNADPQQPNTQASVNGMTSAKKRQSKWDEEFGLDSVPSDDGAGGPSSMFPGLSASSENMARLINVMPLIQQLYDLRSQPPSEKNELARLRVKQQLTDAVLIATLQVRDITARIDRQISIFNRQRSFLEDRRDRAIKFNSIANTFGSGAINEVAQVLQMGPAEISGEVTELVGNAVTTAFGGWALKQQQGPKPVVHSRPNLLAKLFNRSTDRESEYPPVIWAYLNSPAPGDPHGHTRIHYLYERWQKYGAIPDKTQIPLYTSTAPRARITIDSLNDEAALLSDVRAEIYQMDRDLLELLINTHSL